MANNRMSNWARMLAGLALVVAASGDVRAESADPSASAAAQDEAQPAPSKGWVLSVGAGVLSEGGVQSARTPNNRTGMALTLGLGRPLGNRAVWEIGAVVFNLGPRSPDISLVQLKSTWRWYLTPEEIRKDQAYVLAGVTGLLSEEKDFGDRAGGGVVLGIGADILYGRARTMFIEASVSVLVMHKPEKLAVDYLQASNATVGTFDWPFGATAQLIAGARFGL